MWLSNQVIIFLYLRSIILLLDLFSYDWFLNIDLIFDSNLLCIQTSLSIESMDERGGPRTMADRWGSPAGYSWWSRWTTPKDGRDTRFGGSLSSGTFATDDRCRKAACRQGTHRWGCRLSRCQLCGHKSSCWAFQAAGSQECHRWSYACHLGCGCSSRSQRFWWYHYSSANSLASNLCASLFLSEGISLLGWPRKRSLLIFLQKIVCLASFEALGTVRRRQQIPE